jgi:cob(I)alamin adenosyltransferase
MLQKGLIQVYTTESTHTNFAPIGLGLRAAGHKFRTLVTCFVSHELMDGCRCGARLLEPNLLIEHPMVYRQGLSGTYMGDKAHDAFEKTRQAMLRKDFDIVVLNGVHKLLEKAIVSLEDLLRLLEEKPSDVELVFSGMRLPLELIEKADLVTEMIVKQKLGGNNKEKVSEDQGTVEVITGNGKGKTTYALGKAMLSACIGISSSFLQVIKSPKQYGEVMAIKRLPNFEIRTMGQGFLKKKGDTLEKKHIQAARNAWKEWLREVYSSRYGLLVLDEINVATYYELIHPERVEEMLFLKPPKLALLLTGRNAHPDIVKAATTLIDMREIKHPFHKGIKARKGIEY